MEKMLIGINDLDICLLLLVILCTYKTNQICRYYDYSKYCIFQRLLIF